MSYAVHVYSGIYSRDLSGDDLAAMADYGQKEERERVCMCVCVCAYVRANEREREKERAPSATKAENFS